MFFTRFVPRTAQYAYRWDARSAWLTGLYAGMTLPFIGVIARRDLHASPMEISLLISAPFLGHLLSMLVAWHMQSRRKKPYMFWLGIAARSPILLMAFAVSTPLYIGIIIVGQIIGCLTSPAYASIMKDAYPDAWRGRLMGLVRVGMTVMSMVAGLSAGKLMESGGLPWYWVMALGAGAAVVIAHEMQTAAKRVLAAALIVAVVYLAIPSLGQAVSYRIIFPIASALGVLAIIVFNKLPEAAPNASPEGRFNLLEGLTTLFRDRRFGLYSLAYFTFGFGNLLQNPLIPLFQVDELHITYAQVGQLAMVTAGVSAVAYAVWGRFMDRVGPFFTVVLSFAIWGASPFVYAAAHAYTTLFIASVLVGIAGPGNDLTWLNAVLHFTDRDNIPRYAAMHTFLVGIRGFLAPFVSIWLLDLLSLRGCFLVSGGVIGLGTLLMAAVCWFVLIPAQRARNAAQREVAVVTM